MRVANGSAEMAAVAAMAATTYRHFSATKVENIAVVAVDVVVTTWV
ncbi:MAG: hypothetical protein LCI00_26810 [Chloroflexi bacterium]|nr:hypothetical protein [Chloroflexota bacterium]MCC6893954.1 hypothetical protein [Anaerolineae bacterium]